MPMNTIVISTINHRIQPLINQLNAIDWGPHPVCFFQSTFLLVKKSVSLVEFHHIMWMISLDLSLQQACFMLFPAITSEHISRK